MVDKHDVRRLALALDGVAENGEDSFEFRRDGRGMVWPYPERVYPKRARVPRYDQFVMRVADADDKEAWLRGEPDVFFTTDHYLGYGAVIVRLDAIDEARLKELIRGVLGSFAAELPTEAHCLTGFGWTPSVSGSGIARLCPIPRSR